VFTGGIVDMPSGALAAPGLPPLRTIDGSPWPGMIVLSVFPTGTVLIAPDHVMLGMLLPDGPARTRVELHLYFDDAAADWESQQAGRDAALAMWREVLPQDFQFIEGTQASSAMRDAAGIATRFSPYWEQAVRHFQMMVLDAVA
jgi:choline monooxygenase